MHAPLAVLTALLIQAENPHRLVYEAAADSVVAVRATVLGGERSGTGVVWSADGLVLASYAIVPEGSKNVRVWTKGPRRYAAEVVGFSKRDELTLLKILPKGELRPLALGDSRKARIGDVVYTLGNAANSMINCDEPSLNVGVISATYTLDAPRANAHYTGIAIETTAAVNVGMEGAPLLNAAGQMIGFVTLNYSPHRFLGCAIPLEHLKPVVARLTRPRDPETTSDPTPEEGEADFGAEVVDDGGKLRIRAVAAGGPAELAGLRAGIVILSAGERVFKNAAEFAAYILELGPGALLALKVDDEGLIDEVRVQLERKK